MKKHIGQKVLSVVLASVFSISAVMSVPGTKMQVKANSGELSNPRISEDGTVTWDKVGFGSYLQDIKEIKREPIKWRILSVNEDGKEAFVMSDKLLDVKAFNETLKDVTWENCTLRAWLNDTESGFIKEAFTKDEQSVIKTKRVINEDNPENGIDGGNDTYDKVYIPSFSEMTNKDYGFDDQNSYRLSNNRKASITDYVQATSYFVKESAIWYLRTPGVRANQMMYASSYMGSVGGGAEVNCDCTLRIVMNVDLSSELVKNAGIISSKGYISDNTDGYNNPVIDGNTTYWDCIWFGNYNQSVEFEKKPIEWRVLQVNGNDAFLLADKVINYKRYDDIFRDWDFDINETDKYTWENCTLRKWLNGLSEGDFYNDAFNDTEKNAIKTVTLSNKDNSKYNTSGGNDTNDKVFCLSEEEILDKKYGFISDPEQESDIRIAEYTDYSLYVGEFQKKFYSTPFWWLRTPGELLLDCPDPGCGIISAIIVNSGGDVSFSGQNIAVGEGVRPALHVDLSKYDLKKSGTVSAKYNQPEQKDSPTIPATVPGDNPSVVPSSNSTVAPAGVVASSAQPTSTAASTVTQDNKTTFNIKSGATIKKTGKIKITDKDTIKKITLNGKAIKIKKNKTSVTLKLKTYKKKLKKKGKWNTLKITDNKGNTKSIKFKTK